MTEYIEREALENALEDENKNGNFVFTTNWIMEIIDNLPAADVVPKSEVDRLNKELDQLAEELSDLIVEKDQLFDEVLRLRKDLDEYEETSGLKQAKAEVARTFRKRMNEKMGKHTHLLGKEYVQRIMREVEKELIGEEDA